MARRLIVAERAPLLAAALPAPVGGYAFDAVFEFKYLTDSFTVRGAAQFGGAPAGRKGVAADVEKVFQRYVSTRVARLAYVVAFEECDYDFPPGWSTEAEEAHPGGRVRVLRGW